MLKLRLAGLAACDVQAATDSIDTKLRQIDKLQRSVQEWKVKILANEREYSEKCVHASCPHPVLRYRTSCLFAWSFLVH